METQKRPPSSAPHQRGNGHVHKDAGFLAPEGPDDHRVAEGVNRRVRRDSVQLGKLRPGESLRDSSVVGRLTLKPRSSVTLPVPGDSNYGLTL